MSRELNRADPVGNTRQPTSQLGPGLGELPGSRVDRALAYLAAHDERNGLMPAESPRYVTSRPQETSDGAAVVHARQFHDDIPVFMRGAAVRFSPQDQIIDRVGTTAPIRSGFTRPEIKVDAAQAVGIAAAHVAKPAPDEYGRADMFGRKYQPAEIDLTGFEARKVEERVGSSEQVSLFDKGPFDRPIRTQLAWFSLGEDLRLCWIVDLMLLDGQENYIVLVDVDSGEILYVKQRVHNALAEAYVYTKDGGNNRQRVSLPMTSEQNPYPLKLPGTLAPPSEDWVFDNRTSGNCVLARQQPNDLTVTSKLVGGTRLFKAENVDGPEQQVVNIFYLNGFMHDFFYRLGFREVDGNFQSHNFGRGGEASDRVVARAYPGPVWGTASMGITADGSSPVMTMGLVEHASGDRHTAFDASVVFHEFMHGVTTRLVGGPDNAFTLEEMQSGGMGEGWGDYIACSILDEETVGSWVANNPTGIRSHAYTTNHPGRYGDVGKGNHKGVHGIGEIWCAALLEGNRRIGPALMVQLVVDALKLTPANPSFLDARDAILLALQNRRDAGLLTPIEYANKLDKLWQAFAKFGMGVDAKSPGSGIGGIVAGSHIPEPDTPDEDDDVDEPMADTVPGTVVFAGTQFSASIPGGETLTWYTGGWPRDLLVRWSLIPTSASSADEPQLAWSVSTELMSDNSLRYWIEVQNLSSVQVDFDANCVATQT